MYREQGEGQRREAGHDALVARLRTLQWPAAPETSRRRCWERLQEQLDLADDARVVGHARHVDPPAHAAVGIEHGEDAVAE